MPDTLDRIVVPLSRTKISLVLLGSAAFVAIALAVWPAVGLLPRGTLLGLAMHAFLVITIVFFGLCGLYAAVKLFDRTPGLVIDEVGIIDNSSGLAVGRIPWSEIEGIHITRVQGQRFLTLQVRDPEKYVKRSSFLRRQITWLNVKYFNGPIHISANGLKMGFDELVKVVGQRFEEYRRA